MTSRTIFELLLCLLFQSAFGQNKSSELYFGVGINYFTKNQSSDYSNFFIQNEKLNNFGPMLTLIKKNKKGNYHEFGLSQFRLINSRDSSQTDIGISYSFDLILNKKKNKKYSPFIAFVSRLHYKSYYNLPIGPALTFVSSGKILTTGFSIPFGLHFKTKGLNHMVRFETIGGKFAVGHQFADDPRRPLYQRTRPVFYFDMTGGDLLLPSLLTYKLTFKIR